MKQGEQEARNSVTSLPPVVANAAFRTRLNRAFVTGEMELMGASPSQPRWRAWVLIPAAAAALLAMAIVANRGPAWTVPDIRGEGSVWVDGVSYAATDGATLRGLVKSGVTIRTSPGVEMNLACREVFAFQITGGSETTIPHVPGRWFSREAKARVEQGEVRAVTGPRFAGARLRFETDEAVVLVTGTTLAVIRNASGTCVCVWSGEALFGVRGGTPTAVPAGQRRVLYADGRDPLTESLLPGERMKLGMLHESAESLLR